MRVNANLPHYHHETNELAGTINNILSLYMQALSESLVGL